MDENYWKNKWSNEQIKTMLLEQVNAFWQRDTGIVRAQLAAIEQAAPLPHAVLISGLRRVGKSTLLAQIAHRLGADWSTPLGFPPHPIRANFWKT